MTICPACGADIIDSASKNCSSCGSDLKVTKVSDRSQRDDDDTDPTISIGSTETLDDTKPILESDDLKVVHRGEAFWAEQEVPPAAAPSTAQTDSSVEPTVIAKAEQDTEDHGLTLSDLARNRKNSPAGGFSEDDHRPQSNLDRPFDRGQANSLDEKTDPVEIKIEPGTVSHKTQGPKAHAGVTLVSKSPDIAYLEDNKLSIPGVIWTAGQNLVISGETYRLKLRTANKSWSQSGLFTALFGLIVGSVITLLLVGQGGSDSKIVGLIRDRITGNLLPGVRIALQEADQTAQSNSEGVFIFDDLEEGVYTLVATDPIYGVSNSKVTLSGDLATVLIGLERPQVRLPPIKPTKPATPPPSTATAKSGAKPVKSNKRGQLAVTASEPNAKIYIDGKTLGVGNAVYQKIRPGTRRIKVVRRGFQTWEKKVVIKGGVTTRIEPKLVPESEDAPVALSPGQYAFAGRNLLEQHHYGGAIEQFGLAIKGDEAPQFYAWRAEAHAGQGNVTAAESDFMKSVHLFQSAKRPDLLEKMLVVAVGILPSSSSLRMEMGDHMYNRRRLGDADKHYRKALELGHDAGQVYVGLGLSQYAGGDYDGALRSWEYSDSFTGGKGVHIAGYLALGHARLKHRTSCRKMLKRLMTDSEVLSQFRAHPDWERVQRLTGDG